MASQENKRLKHIDAKLNFIRESILNREVQLKYTPTTDQTDDIMTKSLDRILFEKHRSYLNSVQFHMRIFDFIKLRGGVKNSIKYSKRSFHS